MVIAAGERGSDTLAERLEQIYLRLLRRRRQRPHVAAQRPELIDVYAGRIRVRLSHSQVLPPDTGQLEVSAADQI